MRKKAKWVILLICLLTDNAYGFFYPYKCNSYGMFALTFDDGVSKNFDIVLDILSKEKIKATFFIVGETLRTTVNTQRLQRAYKNGHLIANHSWDHNRFDLLSEKNVENEILSTQQKINQIIPIKTNYVRTPYGITDSKSLNVITNLGYTPVYWNLDTKDWKRNSEYILNQYKKILENSDAKQTSFISVHHDRKNETVKALPEIIRMVKEKGFRFVLISDCI